MGRVVAAGDDSRLLRAIPFKMERKYEILPIFETPIYKKYIYETPTYNKMAYSRPPETKKWRFPDPKIQQNGIFESRRYNNMALLRPPDATKWHN